MIAGEARLKRVVIHVALIDGHPLFRQGFRTALSRFEDIRVVSVFEDFDAARDWIIHDEPDVLVLEPSGSAEGLDLVQELGALQASPKILALTVDKSPHYAFRLFRVGALGWLSKTASAEDVAAAIREVSRGEVFVPKPFQEEFAKRFVRPDRFSDLESKLTNRELQTARLLALGKTTREIAAILRVDMRTISSYRASLLKKLNLRNNMEVTRFAIRIRLVEV